MDNPDTALPLYLLCVLAGIMLGQGWRNFLAEIGKSSRAASTQAMTAGSSAAMGGQQTP